MLGPERYPFQDAQQKIYITRQNIPKILPSLEAHSRYGQKGCVPLPLRLRALLTIAVIV